jgi:hypothetical protein
MWALASSVGSTLSCNRLNMQRSSTSLIGLFALHLACGAPAELDTDLFPAPADTGYTDSAIGAAGTPNVTGNGGGPSAGGRGGTGGGGGGSAGAPPANGGASSTPGAGGAGGGGSGCPADVTTLFNRPANKGGCADNGCHVASGGIAPDLVSPGVVQRLLDVPSTCQGIPYIGDDVADSFLADKIAGHPPKCNQPMPFFQEQALSAADEKCILDWVAQVGGGG